MTAAIISLVIAPGRSRTGCLSERMRERSRIVDSIPTSHGPPSRISKSAPNSSRTCCAVVGEIWPNLLAEGAAMMPLPTLENSTSNCCASGCAGQRNPTVSCPPVTAFGTRADFFKISVSGPGQNASVSFFVMRGISIAHVSSFTFLGT